MALRTGGLGSVPRFGSTKRRSYPSGLVMRDEIGGSFGVSLPMARFDPPTFANMTTPFERVPVARWDVHLALVRKGTHAAATRSDNRFLKASNK